MRKDPEFFNNPENQRLRQLKKVLGFTHDKDFAEKLGLKPGSLSDVLRGKVNVSESIILRLFLHFRVNPYWVSEGTEPILLDESSSISFRGEEPPMEYYKGFRPLSEDYEPIKIVEPRAQAGYLRGYSDPEYIETLPQILINSRSVRGGSYKAFVVDGDSMDDGTWRSFLPGDTIVGKELQKEYWTQRIRFNQYLFVIIHKEGVLFKEIISHEVDKGLITVHSFNSMYTDEVLNLRDCYQLFYIKKLFERDIRF